MDKDLFWQKYNLLVGKFEELKRTILNSKKLAIFSHNDSDGYCSAKILLDTIHFLKKDTHVWNTYGFDNEIFIKKSSKFDTIIILDMGATNQSEISHIMRKKSYWILDHHSYPARESEDNLIHPSILELDGGMNMCTTVLTYLFQSYIRGFVNVNIEFLIGGFLGDKQDLRPTEFSHDLLKVLQEAGILEYSVGHITYLSSYGKLKLYHQVEPYLPNITHNDEVFSDRISDLRAKAQISLGNILRDMELSRIRILYNNMDGREILEFSRAWEIGFNNQFYSSKNNSFSGNPQTPEKVWVLRGLIKKFMLGTLPKLEKIYHNNNIFIFNKHKRISAPVVIEILSMYLYSEYNLFFISEKSPNRWSVSVRRKLGSEAHLNELAKSIADKFGGSGGGHKAACGFRFSGVGRDKLIETLIRELDQFGY